MLFRPDFAILLLATALLSIFSSAAWADRLNPLTGAKTFGFQLKNLEAGPRKIIANSPYDMVVIDYARGEVRKEVPLTKDEVGELQKKSDGSKRAVIAYISIGETENYRFYWKNEWDAQRPSWMGKENKNRPGRFLAKYWEPEWQKIVYGHPQAYVDKILTAGFDGVLIDGADVYAYFGDNEDARARIAKFIVQLAGYMRAKKPDAAIMVQGGEELLSRPDYLGAIDGVVKENLLFGLNGQDVANAATAVQQSSQLLKKAKEAGKFVFVVEYLRDKSNIAAAAKNVNSGLEHLYVGCPGLETLGKSPLQPDACSNRLVISPAQARYASPKSIDQPSRASAAPNLVLYGASKALVIGIDNYGAGHAVRPWPQLSMAIKDAQEVAAALTGQGFQVTLKTDLGSADLEATLRDFFLIEGADPDARLLVWFAGHGHTIEGEGYLVPVDAPGVRPYDVEFRRKAISLRRFGEYMREARSKHVLAIFDSCFAGTVFNVARALPSPAITYSTGYPVRQFVSSGEAEQMVSDDGTFRKLFVDALKGLEPTADANGDGYITGSELGQFLFDKVTIFSNKRQTPRYGKMIGLGLDRGDFVFEVNKSIGAPLIGSTGPSHRLQTKQSELNYAATTAPPNKSRLMIEEWSGSIATSDDKFFSFVERNENKIMRIDTGLSDGFAEYDETLKKCIVRHTKDDEFGTEYLIDCAWRVGEWRVKGFFTQKEMIAKRGRITVDFERVPDGIVMAQDPELVKVKQ